LSRKDLSTESRAAAVKHFFEILDEQRPIWERELREINEELAALKRKIGEQTVKVTYAPHKWTKADRDAGLDRDARREAARPRSWEADLTGYTDYTRALSRLLSVEPARQDPSKLRIDEL